MTAVTPLPNIINITPKIWIKINDIGEIESKGTIIARRDVPLYR